MQRSVLRSRSRTEVELRGPFFEDNMTIVTHIMRFV